MFTHLLFDLDGTLTNPFDGISNAVCHALEKRGIRIRDRKSLTSFIGPPLPDSFMEFCHMTREEALAAVEDFREYYADRGWHENIPYPGVADMLAALCARGKKLFVATSKPEFFAEKILSRFALADYFDGIAGATMDETRTKKADVIAYCLARFSVPSENTLMIGDRKHDILGAKANGLHSLGVLYGFGSREELLDAGADLIAETPADVPSAID